MYISKETQDLIRERARIEDIVMRYVPTLKLKGKNYLGLCPFHTEKTPSFTVSPEKQIFYCFGCHAGGNVFSFISKIERLEFPENIVRLAGLVGVEIRDEKGDSDRYSSIYRVYSYAKDLYSKYIKSDSGSQGYKYLTGRGVSNESIEAFSLGFSPDQWDFLTGYLKKNSYDLSKAAEIGIITSVVKNGSKHYYDRFRNRVMFPIRDISGKTVAFGGRIIGEGTPKYLNSPESEIFQKRSLLYGLDLAKESIRETSRAIVVEGYLDVIGCHQAGIKNVVAPLGTALTENHFQIISRMASEMILLFDADSAGMNAALRSLETSDKFSLDVKVAILPEGDPFDFIIKKGAREFIALVDRSQSPTEFRISRIIENQGASKINTMLSIFPVIMDLKHESERGMYIKKISSILELDEQSVRSDFKKYLSREKIDTGEKKKPARVDFFTRSFGDLIKLLCACPRLIEKASIDFNADEISDIPSQNIIKKIYELHYSGEPFSIDKLFDFFKDGYEMELLNNAVNSEFHIDNPDRAYTEIYIKLRLQNIDNKINKFASIIKKSPESHYSEYLTEIEVLRREKEKLNNYLLSPER